MERVVFMDKQKHSTHISTWIDNDLLKECSVNQKALNIKTRGDYIEKALRFYNGYLCEKNNEQYINKTVMAPLDKMMRRLENRMARLMFKQAVEICKLFWLVTKGFDLDPEDTDLLHQDCLEEVKRINGAIRFPYNKKYDDD